MKRASIIIIFINFIALNFSFSQDYFSKLIKIHRDTAQIFTTPYLVNDSIFTYICFIKKGVPSSAIAVFDTSMNYNREIYFPTIDVNLVNSSGRYQTIMYQSGKEISPNGTVSDTQTLISYDFENKTLKKVKNIATGSYLKEDNLHDQLYTYKDTTYLFSAYGYLDTPKPYKLIINRIDKDMNPIDTKYINFANQSYISDIIKNDKFIYILGILDTVINKEYVYVYKLKKLDLNFNTIWDKSYQSIDFADAHPGRMTFDGDDIIMSLYTDRVKLDHYVNWINPVIVRVDADGNIKWKVDFLNRFDSGAHTIKTLKNGDILFCGVNSSYDFDAQCGWLVRMKPTGEVLWNKMYFDHRSGDARFGYLYDFVELEGGNIIAVGAYQHADSTSTGIPTNFTSAWAIKIGPDGCPGFECDSVVHEYTLNTPTPITIDRLNIYPNPTTGLVYGDGDLVYADRTLRILNFTGRVVYVGKTQDLVSGIDISRLPQGIYFISINGIGVHKIIKI